MSQLDYIIYFTKFFKSQVLKLNEKEKRIIKSKIELVKSNPTRFKKLQGYKNVFEIKISVQNNYSRLIFALYEPDKKSITMLKNF